MARPCAIAVAGSEKQPPSENESGVTLRTPITTQCPGRGRAVLTAPSPAEHEAHGLAAGGGAVAEDAPHRGGDRGGAGLADAAHGHAQVLGLDDHDDTLRLEDVVERIGDLAGQPLL